MDKVRFCGDSEYSFISSLGGWVSERLDRMCCRPTLKMFIFICAFILYLPWIPIQELHLLT